MQAQARAAAVLERHALPVLRAWEQAGRRPSDVEARRVEAAVAAWTRAKAQLSAVLAEFEERYEDL